MPHMRPGQFMLAGPEGRREWLLPRPLLPAGYDLRTRVAEILVPGQETWGTDPHIWPAETQLRVLAPLGRPFVIDGRTRRAVLVGTAAGLAPLLFLARSLVADGLEVTLIALFPLAADAMPGSALPHEVEYLAISEEAGGVAGLNAATDPLIPWADALYLALPMDRLPSILTLLRRRLLRLRKGYAQALLVPSLLPCGVGACDMCPVEAHSGTRRLCRDGLVFDLLTLI
jgi:dihydroorotate dehydrogenase electron transfer subunit